MEKVEKDIELAKKIINGEIDKLFSYIYPFTTENIKGYYDLLDLKNKDILTVGSSGDHTLNLYLKNVKSVDFYDINPFSEYFFNLKKTAIEQLELYEFLDYFCYIDYPKMFYNNKNSFNLKMYYKISPYLDEKTKYFWNNLYIDYFGLDIRKSNLFSKDETDSRSLIKSNDYLDVEKYYELKNLLSFQKEPKYYNDDIKTLVPQKKYDVIMLSNIAKYLEYMYKDNYLENFSNLVKRLDNYLNDDGIIVLSYLFNLNNSIYALMTPSIYNLEELSKYLDFEIYKFRGIENIKFHQQTPIKDAILVYKKTK